MRLGLPFGGQRRKRKTCEKAVALMPREKVLPCINQVALRKVKKGQIGD